MLHFTRYLATRLRRITSVAPAATAYVRRADLRTHAATSWERLDAFITFAGDTPRELRERELVEENARAAIALIGHDGGRLVQRVAQLHEAGAARASEPALLVLTLAYAHGDPSMRDEALRALARVARVNARLTPPGVQREGTRRDVARFTRT